MEVILQSQEQSEYSFQTPKKIYKKHSDSLNSDNSKQSSSYLIKENQQFLQKQYLQHSYEFCSDQSLEYYFSDNQPNESNYQETIKKMKRKSNRQRNIDDSLQNDNQQKWDNRLNRIKNKKQYIVQTLFPKNHIGNQYQRYDRISGRNKQIINNKRFDRYKIMTQKFQQEGQQLNKQLLRCIQTKKERQQQFRLIYIEQVEKCIKKQRLYYYNCKIIICAEFESQQKYIIQTQKISAKSLQQQILTYVRQRHLIKENQIKKIKIKTILIAQTYRLRQVQSRLYLKKINIKPFYFYSIRNASNNSILDLTIKNKHGQILYSGVIRQILSIDFSQVQIAEQIIYPHGKSNILNLPSFCIITHYELSTFIQKASKCLQDHIKLTYGKKYKILKYFVNKKSLTISLQRT